MTALSVLECSQYSWFCDFLISFVGLMSFMVSNQTLLIRILEVADVPTRSQLLPAAFLHRHLPGVVPRHCGLSSGLCILFSPPLGFREIFLEALCSLHPFLLFKDVCYISAVFSKKLILLTDSLFLVCMPIHGEYLVLCSY